MSGNPISRICVVGCPRSGTTVVQSLLGAHPDVLAFPETQFAASSFGDQTERFFLKEFSHKDTLRNYVRRIRLNRRIATSESRSRYQKFCELNGITPKDQRIPLVSTSIRIRDWVSVFDDIARRAHKLAWSEKTPSHLAYVEQLRDLIPDLRIVYVQRNAFKVIDSLMYANKMYANSPAWVDFSHLDYCIEIWRNSRKLMMENFDGRRDVLFDFDSFISDPKELTSKLQASLNLRPLSADEILSRRANASDGIVKNVEPWKKNVLSHIVEDTGQFRVISNKDKEYIQAQLSDVL